jgi:hypothetical protein
MGPVKQNQNKQKLDFATQGRWWWSFLGCVNQRKHDNQFDNTSTKRLKGWTKNTKKSHSHKILNNLSTNPIENTTLLNGTRWTYSGGKTNRSKMKLSNLIYNGVL